LHTYFPYIYDIKYLMKSCEKLKGGLNQLAEDLEIKRIGPAHQAGSDSLLTSATFFKMMKLYFENKLDDKRHLGKSQLIINLYIDILFNRNSLWIRKL